MATPRSPASLKARAAPASPSTSGTRPESRRSSCRRCSLRRCLFPALGGSCSATRARPFLLSRDPGLEHLRAVQLGHACGADVAIDDHEIGPFAGIERADLLFG